MSTFNRIVVTFGLCVACSWTVPDVRVRPTLTSRHVSSRAARVTAGRSGRAPRERDSLLTSGQLIKGVLTESPTECLVEQRVGTMHFPKKRVEGAFDSIREAYKYRLTQLPERDSDERMKLALWCLNLKLSAEAARASQFGAREKPQSRPGQGHAGFDRSGDDPAGAASVTRTFARLRPRCR